MGRDRVAYLTRLPGVAADRRVELQRLCGDNVAVQEIRIGPGTDLASYRPRGRVRAVVLDFVTDQEALALVRGPLRREVVLRSRFVDQPRGGLRGNVVRFGGYQRLMVTGALRDLADGALAAEMGHSRALAMG